MKRKKFKKSTCNKFSKVFIQIPGTYKKALGHTGTTRNVQNKCIKLSGFDVDTTNNWSFSTPGNNKKHFPRRKVLQHENSSAGF